MTTHKMHDRCIAARRKLLDRDPELARRAAARGTPLKSNTPEHDLAMDLAALDAVAASFATGLDPTSKERRRASTILVELGL